MKKLLFAALAALFTLSSQAQQRDSLRVLWVGNSFTFYNDLPEMVRQIASTQKKKLSMTRYLKGGERFSGHLKNQKLREALAAGGWDYVILQEQSTAPALSTAEVARDVYPAARELDSLAHAGSPEVKVVFYMTWGHKYGNRKPVAEYPLVNDYESMQERLKTSYLEMTYDNNALCAPVGMAWRCVRHAHPEWVLYRPDCYHPAVAGSYLAANVIFTTLFPKPYQTAFTADLPAEQAEVLQQTAQRTVLENLKLINLGE